MPKLRHLFVTALLVLFAASTLHAAKSGYYRWVDDGGKPQFTQKPPVDKPYEYVEVSTGHSQPVSRSTTDAANNDSAKGADDGAVKDQEVQAAAAKDPALCAQARQNLATLGAGLVRLKQPDGSYTILSEEDKAAQRQRAQSVIDFHCE
ncbi:MAG TPA: DUF4124 domain-containing protein [Spongiibacteraceae bacterium]|jgi:hypothetical protein|nr:DUF4124 domain-containing protein [Spongiibacteraceae bacterium]HUH37531.1 DUF4124 domain-containing protein [Spongiibacteraceae bacterium]